MLTAKKWGEYLGWIAKNVKGDPVGQCIEATLAMVCAFPELRRVRGWYVHDGHELSHWWCVTDTGEIVDPTAGQFPEGGEYIEHDEFRGEPAGKCRDCGAYVYRDEGASIISGEVAFCNETHQRRYIAYVMSGRP